MKIWTIQAPEVVEAILDKGVYYPDFSQSSTLRQVPAYSSLYNSVLESYNRMNCTKAKGLIFGFRKCESENTIVDISTLNEFYGLLEENLDYVGQMIKGYRDKNAIILELDYNNEFLNPLHIDIPGFKALEYCELKRSFILTEKYKSIKHNFVNGFMGTPIFSKSTNLIQVHIDCISNSNLINTYALSNFELK